MAITLIGYRGSGKSSVAPELARRLNCAWIDADVELERRAGRTIRQIFETSGEQEFRRLEREILRELLQDQNLIIAAGGGAILSAVTRQRMRASGPVVWLQASVALLARRIAGDAVTAQRRPALSVSGRDDIGQILATREPFYRECANVIIDTDGQTVEQVVDQAVSGLLKFLKKQPPRGRGPS